MSATTTEWLQVAGILLMVAMIGACFGMVFGGELVKAAHCRTLDAEDYRTDNGRITCLKVTREAVQP